MPRREALSVVDTDDRFVVKALSYRDVTALVASVDKEAFCTVLLRFVSQAARIDNFGAYYVSELGKVTPVLSLWSGKMSDYQFHRNAAELMSHESIRNEILSSIRKAPVGGALMERWHPPKGDPRAAIYERSEVLEKVTVSTRMGRGGFQTFYGRSLACGWLSEDEMARLETVLPLAHELTGLRHRLVGSDAFRFTPSITASSLRERNVTAFASLSEREAEVCDCIVKGLTVGGTAMVLGIAETSTRTLRQRAYRKLNVTSATELMALMLHDHRAKGE